MDKPISNGVPNPAPRLSFTQSQAAAAVANQVHSETAIVDQRPPYAVLKAKDDVLNQNGWTYPWSLLEEVRSNQRSPINPCHLMEKRDHQQAQQEKPEDSNVLPPINKETDFFEKEDPHAFPPNPDKSDLLEKKDSQRQAEEHHVLPPNLEKSDFFEKKDNQPQVSQEDRNVFPQNNLNAAANNPNPKHKPEDIHAEHALPQNPEKNYLLEKKDNQARHPPENQQALLLNPENPDLMFQKDNQREKKGDREENLQTELLKPESQRQQTVLGNPKVEQEEVGEIKKQSFRQYIKKSLGLQSPVKQQFQQRKQVELENNPTVDKCVINGKTFPLMNQCGYDYKFAAVHYNVWESIGKPKINQTNRTLLSQNKKTSYPVLGEIKVEIVINNKTRIIPILVINDPLSKDKNKTVYIINSN
jgi:hypothetical protein